MILGLQGGDEILRGYSGVALVEAGKPAVPALIKLLESENKVTVSTAAAVLGKIGSPAVPDLIAALKHDNSQVRGFALLAFGKMGNAAKVAVPAIRKRLNDNHEGVRRYAASLLSKLSP